MATLNSQVKSASEDEFDVLRYNQAMEHLVRVIQSLSMAHDLASVMDIVRMAARELTGADGATFVLREGDSCYYAEENAIEPLWKGRKFPMEACISGWVMLNRQSLIIEDIYQDPRIPQDAYKPTFVKSLAMVPIRTTDPLGAIGNYWAKRHFPSDYELKLLQALADTTAVAMENVRLYTELEQRVEERTAQLKAANQDLEAFSYSISHDLRAPLRAISGFNQAALDDMEASHLSEKSQHYLLRVQANCQFMNQLIDDMLQMSRLTRNELSWETDINLSDIAQEFITQLQQQEPERTAQVIVQPNVLANGDRHLLEAVMQNLLGNAWKFSSKCPMVRIEFGQCELNGMPTYFVKDNGDGFDMAYAGKLFTPFQRLHTQNEFPGTGVGLATVQRIVHKHGGRIWVEAEPGKGATFYFTLG